MRYSAMTICCVLVRNAAKKMVAGMRGFRAMYSRTSRRHHCLGAVSPSKPSLNRLLSPAAPGLHLASSSVTVAPFFALRPLKHERGTKTGDPVRRVTGVVGGSLFMTLHHEDASRLVCPSHGRTKRSNGRGVSVAATCSMFLVRNPAPRLPRSGDRQQLKLPAETPRKSRYAEQGLPVRKTSVLVRTSLATHSHSHLH